MKHKRLGNILDSFELFYEEMEKKPVKTAQRQTEKSVSTVEERPALQVVFQDYITKARGKFYNTAQKLNLRRKHVRKLARADKLAARKQKIHGIIGIGLLFVVVSITYSTYMTNLFVDGTAMVFFLAPQVIFAGVTLLIAFYKIYK